MKGIYKGLIGMAFIFLISPLAEAQIYQGQKLVEDWKAKIMTASEPPKALVSTHGTAHYMGYVVGVYDTHHNLFNLPPSVTIDQICNVIGKYLDEHPEEWNEPDVKLVLRGLLEMPFQKVPIKKS